MEYNELKVNVDSFLDSFVSFVKTLCSELAKEIDKEIDKEKDCDIKEHPTLCVDEINYKGD